MPKTVILPSNQHPPDTTAESMSNLVFPLEWEEMFQHIGFPAYFKPYSGGGWKSVYRVTNPHEFFEAYKDSGQNVMTLQEEIVFNEYFRCYSIGRKYVHIMRYDPREPHANRYVLNAPPIDPALYQRVHDDCLKLMHALGYDFCTLEFAVRDGIPYAIDFLNPAPDAGRRVGRPGELQLGRRARHQVADRARPAGAGAADELSLGDVPRRRRGAGRREAPDRPHQEASRARSEAGAPPARRGLRSPWNGRPSPSASRRNSRSSIRRRGSFAPTSRRSSKRERSSSRSA